MKLKFFSGLTTMLLIVSLSAFQSSNTENVYQDNWTKLGSRVVNYGLESDVILVGAAQGGFTKLKVEVTGGALNMHRMIVTYGNGTKDEIPLRHNFAPESGSRVIDLAGGKRIIRKITFVYDTKNLARKKAVVHVYARR